MTKHTFPRPLIRTQFVKRYKRFFVDALYEGETLVAHCANTGSMKGLIEEGVGAYLLHHDDPKRKLKYSLEMLDAGTSLVGVNTSIPNSLTAEGITNGDIPELAGYASLRREVKYGAEGKSRIDILLEDDSKAPCYVEVKNVTLKHNSEATALFPDAVTTRGTKHLNELMEEVKKGNRAVMFYLVQREDCTAFAPAGDIDPEYTSTLKKAVKAGVEVIAYSCTLTSEAITLGNAMEVRL